MNKNPKTITIRQFDHVIRGGDEQQVEIRDHVNQFREFDPEGRMVRDIRYNQQGDFEDMTVYEYDNSGRLARECYYPYEDEMAEELNFTYGEGNRIIHAKKKYQDGSVDTISYVYSEEGLLTKKITTNDDGEVEQTELFSYSDGQLTGQEVFDSEGSLISLPVPVPEHGSEQRVTNNEQGQVILEEEINAQGEVVSSISRNYLEDGRPDEVEVFIDGQGRMISRHYILKYEYTYHD